MTKRTVIAVLSLSCCFNLSINLHAQGGSDVSQQIKQLQQESRDAQMKNDVSLFGRTTTGWRRTTVSGIPLGMLLHEQCAFRQKCGLAVIRQRETQTELDFLDHLAESIPGVGSRVHSSDSIRCDLGGAIHLGLQSGAPSPEYPNTPSKPAIVSTVPSGIVTFQMTVCDETRRLPEASSASAHAPSMWRRS
jgi:hypothetical protein